MLHKMNLYIAPFQSIKSGRKTVEVRLNDEKRRKVNVGDTIEFTKIPEGKEKLRVEVIGLQKFTTFREMYDTLPSEKFDTVSMSIDDMVKSTYEIYPPEQEMKWGTLAISIKLI